MTVLLARTAERLYWGARYVERAEDTARIVRAYNDLVVDFPSQELLRWEPLAAIAGSHVQLDIPASDPSGERTVLEHLLADRDAPNSIASSVRQARENFRTTREVMPREGWQAINQLAQYVDTTASAAIERQLRDRFLVRVIDISRRLDGVLESTMSRSEAYQLIRLGRLIERADMTTRVLGVAAAAILQLEATDRAELVNDEVRWMSVLRSVSALQMYQRATRGPIDARAVVAFLLGNTSFPRSLRGCLASMRAELVLLPTPEGVLAQLDATDTAARSAQPDASVGAELDQAMDVVQQAIADLHGAIADRYLHVQA